MRFQSIFKVFKRGFSCFLSIPRLLARCECQFFSKTMIFIIKTLDYACEISKLLILQTKNRLFFLIIRAETIEVFAKPLKLARHSPVILNALESIS